MILLNCTVEKLNDVEYILEFVSVESIPDSISEKQEEKISFNNWLNTKEAAKALGISIRTLQSYRDQCIIPFSQFGREIRYRAEDIQDFLIKFYNKPRFWKDEGGDHE